MNTENSSGSSPDVSVQCESTEPPSWLSAYRRFLTAVLELQGMGSWELSILLTDDETIRTYNRDFRQIDSATDILSFSQSEGIEVPVQEGSSIPAGDLLISLESVERNAKDYGVSLLEELRRVSIHGILHLAGYTHAGTDVEQEPMLLLQEQIMQSIPKEYLF